MPSGTEAAKPHYLRGALAQEWEPGIGSRHVQAPEGHADGTSSKGLIGTGVRVSAGTLVIAAAAWAIRRWIGARRVLPTTKSEKSSLMTPAVEGIASTSTCPEDCRDNMLPLNEHEDLEAQARHYDDLEAPSAIGIDRQLHASSLACRGMERRIDTPTLECPTLPALSTSLVGMEIETDDMESGVARVSQEGLDSGLDSGLEEGRVRQPCNVVMAVAACDTEDGSAAAASDLEGDGETLAEEGVAIPASIASVTLGGNPSAHDFSTIDLKALTHARTCGFDDAPVGSDVHREKKAASRPRSAAGLLTSVKSAPGAFGRLLSRTLSHLSSGLRTSSRETSGDQCGCASEGGDSDSSERFADPEAIMEAVRLAEEAMEAGSAVRELVDRRAVLGGSRPVPETIIEVVEETEGDGDNDDGEEEGEAEGGFARRRLVNVFRGFADLALSLRGVHLARSCSLSHAEENGDLQWGEILGSGKYGLVTRVEHELGPFAVKELTEDAEDYDRVTAEFEMDAILSLGHHENLVQVFAMDDTLPTMPIMMEAGMGDLLCVLSGGCSMHGRIQFLLGCARGLRHMHACGKVHGDVKAKNVLIVENREIGKVAAKVADFGLTVDVGDIIPVSTGTHGYMAPELLADDAVAGTDMDVFSFAVLMLQAFVPVDFLEVNMFAHSLLLTPEEAGALEDMGEVDLYEELRFKDAVMQRTIGDGSFEREILVPENIHPAVPKPEYVCDVLKLCLSPDRATRPNMADVEGVLSDLSRWSEP